MNQMGVQKTNESAKLVLKVRTSHDAEEKAVVATRTFNNVNPAISEKDVYEVGKAIADLQVYPLESVKVQETANLSE